MNPVDLEVSKLYFQVRKCRALWNCHSERIYSERDKDGRGHLGLSGGTQKYSIFFLISYYII